MNAKTKSTKKPVRARNSKGHYQADNPETPDVNEAFVQEEKPAKPSTPASGVVYYESREKEPSMFDVADISSTRDFSDGRLNWKVQASDVERFEQHHFVQSGRVRRK